MLRNEYRKNTNKNKSYKILTYQYKTKLITKNINKNYQVNKYNT